jgi:hypothetical protein
MQWIFWGFALLVALGAGYMVYRADVKRGAPYPRVTAALRTVVWLLVFFRCHEARNRKACHRFSSG